MTSAEVSAVLLKVVLDDQNALKRGLKDRERMAQQIARGEAATGVRADWLRDTAYALNDTLMEQARKFNEAYPSDKISVHDLCDAMGTLQAFLMKAAKGGGKAE